MFQKIIIWAYFILCVVVIGNRMADAAECDSQGLKPYGSVGLKIDGDIGLKVPHCVWTL